MSTDNPLNLPALLRAVKAIEAAYKGTSIGVVRVSIPKTREAWKHSKKTGFDFVITYAFDGFQLTSHHALRDGYPIEGLSDRIDFRINCDAFHLDVGGRDASMHTAERIMEYIRTVMIRTHECTQTGSPMIQALKEASIEMAKFFCDLQYTLSNDSFANFSDDDSDLD